MVNLVGLKAMINHIYGGHQKGIGTMSLTNLINELNQEDKPDLIVTPGVEDFLAKQGNIVVNSEELQDKLIDIVSDNSNSVRVGRFGASSRGTCLRAQVFRFTGDVEERTWIDTTLQNLFNDGTWRHIRWQMMCLLGNILTDVETKVTNPKYPNFGGSIDGIGSVSYTHLTLPTKA